MARKRKEQQSESGAVEATAALFAVEAPAVTEAAPEHVPVECPAPKAWRVQTEQRVSLWGHLTTMPAGTIIKAGEYGDAGLERLREQGVLLVPV